MLDRIRALVRRYRREGDAPFTGAPSACSPTTLPARSKGSATDRPPRSAFADATVVVPGTWVVFDHFTHRGDAARASRATPASRAAVERRLDGYTSSVLLGTQPSIPGPVRGRGPVRASLDRATYLDRAAAAKRAIYEGDVYQLQLGIRLFVRTRGLAVRRLSPDSGEQPIAVHVLHRGR